MVDSPHLFANRRRQRHRVCGAANHKGHGARGVLRYGQECLATFSQLKARPAHIANDSEYGQPWTARVRVAVLEPLSDRIFSRPETSSHAVVDDHDPRRILSLGAVKFPAIQ